MASLRWLFDPVQNSSLDDLVFHRADVEALFEAQDRDLDGKLSWEGLWSLGHIWLGWLWQKRWGQWCDGDDDDDDDDGYEGNDGDGDGDNNDDNEDDGDNDDDDGDDDDDDDNDEQIMQIWDLSKILHRQIFRPKILHL